MDELFSEMTVNYEFTSTKKNAGGFTLRKKVIGVRNCGDRRLTENTVTNYTKKYDEKALYNAYEEDYHQPKKPIVAVYRTAKRNSLKASASIWSTSYRDNYKETGIRLKPSACRVFLKKWA